MKFIRLCTCEDYFYIVPIAISLAKHWLHAPWPLYLHSQLSLGIEIPPKAGFMKRQNRINTFCLIVAITAAFAYEMLEQLSVIHASLFDEIRFQITKYSTNQTC